MKEVKCCPVQGRYKSEENNPGVIITTATQKETRTGKTTSKMFKMFQMFSVTVFLALLISMTQSAPAAEPACWPVIVETCVPFCDHITLVCDPSQPPRCTKEIELQGDCGRN